MEELRLKKNASELANIINDNNNNDNQNLSNSNGPGSDLAPG